MHAERTENLRQRELKLLLKRGYLKTTFVYKFCPSEPPGLCFEEYHTKIDFYVYIGIMKFIAHIIIGCV